MKTRTYTTGIQVSNDQLPFWAELEVEFTVVPEEPMVRYYPDGSGYPGAPAYVEISEVYVIRAITMSLELENADLEKMGGDGSWLRWMESIAFNYLCEHQDEHEDELLEAIEQENE